MERTKLLTIAVVALFVLNLLTIGFVLLRPDRPMPPGGRPGMGTEPAMLIIERLHLDARQQEQFRQLRDEHQAQLRPLNEKGGNLYTDYYILLKAEQVDTAQANAISDQIAHNQRAIAQVNFQHFQQLKALCRPDQQADFEKLLGDLTKIFRGSQRPKP